MGVVGQSIQAAMAKAKNRKPGMPGTSEMSDRSKLTGIQNPYTDTGRREQIRSRFTEALEPQKTAATERVTSSVDPYMTGKRSASLLREVDQPAMQALAGFELGQEEKGQGYAAESPFREADYLGNLNGRETIGGADKRYREAALTGKLG